MHRDAEYGIAAGLPLRPPRARARTAPVAGRGPASAGPLAEHAGVGGPGGPNHLDWLHTLVEWQRERRRPAALHRVAALRPDRGPGARVRRRAAGCCCRPTRRRSTSPTRSSPDVGDRCVAATVNGQLVFLSSPLADGDVVEIHTADEHGPDDQPVGPSPEWLTFVRTPHAQLHIEASARAARLARQRPAAAGRGAGPHRSVGDPDGAAPARAWPGQRHAAAQPGRRAGLPRPGEPAASRWPTTPVARPRSPTG